MSTTVVAVDESEGAKHALDWAVAHGSADDNLILITVLPSARRGQGYEPPHRSEREAAEVVLEKLKKQAEGRAGGVASEVLEGSPAGEILDAAKRHNADHIVLGARGVGGFAGLLIGSVSNAVVSHATCPVTVVPDDRG